MRFGINFSFEGWKKRINDAAGFNLKINSIRKIWLIKSPYHELEYSNSYILSILTVFNCAQQKTTLEMQQRN